MTEQKSRPAQAANPTTKPASIVARSADHSNQPPLPGMPALPPDGINEFWEADASRVIAMFAATGREFTADDVHQVEGIGRPERSSVVGSVFAAAHRHRVITRVGYRPSTRSGRNGSAVAIWAGVRNQTPETSEAIEDEVTEPVTAEDERRAERIAATAGDRR